MHKVCAGKDREYDLAAQPTTVQNGKLTGINSQITAINAQANTFTAQTPDGFTFTFGSNGSTAFQGVAAFSTLSIGVLVNLNAAIQRDGSFLATRVEVDDLGAPATNTGPTEVGPNSQTASFRGSSLFQGQHVSVYSSGALGSQSSEIVTAVTLVPQTINGTVTAVSQENGFTVYTVALAAYDLFPVLQQYVGPYPHINSPTIVVVYVYRNTQLLNHGLINLGTLARLRGLVFDDNGTMRMD